MKKIAKLLTLALGVIMLASCEDVPSPYGTVTPPEEPSQVLPVGDGTKDNPYNVAGAVEKCKEIGTEVSTEKYYVKGLVLATASATGDYGNATFYIYDEGSSTKFYCYQVAGPDGKKLSDGYTFKADDEVVIYGPMYNFQGKTPETASKGAAWVVLHNGEAPGGGGGGSSTDQPKGNGKQDNPYNVSGVLNYIESLGADVTSPTEVYIKGKVKNITEQFGTQYGNATFTMVDEGFDATFTAYRILYLGNKKYTEGDLLKTGDEVIVCGKVVNFKGNVPETSQGSAYLYSLNGNTGGGGGTPSETLGTKDNPLNVANALEYISALADNAKTDKFAYVKGTIKTIKTKDEDIAKYKNIDYIITDGTNDVTVFRGKNLNNTDFTAAGQINVGDEVIVYGQLTKYVKDGAVTPEVAQGNYLVSLKSGGSGGGGGQSSYSINFKTNGQGEWTINDKTKPAEVEKIWQYDSKYGMKASAFASSTNYASESLLISPKFSLEGASKATLTIKHAINFFASVDAAKTEAQVLVSIDGGTNWTALTLNGWPDKLSWTFFESTADFSAYAGKKDLQIALKYSSTADKAGTWEIESFTIE